MINKIFLFCICVFLKFNFVVLIILIFFWNLFEFFWFVDLEDDVVDVIIGLFISIFFCFDIIFVVIDGIKFLL